MDGWVLLVVVIVFHIFWLHGFYLSTRHDTGLLKKRQTAKGDEASLQLLFNMWTT